MKKINKIEPNFYREKLDKERPESWESVSFKAEIRVYSLCNEQNYQCAYTETRIDEHNSHTDHFVKQSFIKQGFFKPLNVFSWENLLTSCNIEFYGAIYKDKKIKIEDYSTILNPEKESSLNYFKYSWTGEILVDPSDKKGKRTIQLFNLNDNSLIEQRKTVAFQLKMMYDQMTLQEIIGTIGKFESMIIYLHNQLNDN